MILPVSAGVKQPELLFRRNDSEIEKSEPHGKPLSRGDHAASQIAGSPGGVDTKSCYFFQVQVDSDRGQQSLLTFCKEHTSIEDAVFQFSSICGYPVQ